MSLAENMCDTCNVSQGARDWCEYCGGDTTPPKALSVPESDERITVALEPTYSLTGLTERHVRALWDILMRTRPSCSADVEVITILGATLEKINK